MTSIRNTLLDLPNVNDFSDQWVLVTGSSRGIGHAIALRAARDGYNLVVHCREDVDSAEETADSCRALGAATRILQFDVGNRTQVRSTLEADVEEHGTYYGVICNAGIVRDTAFPMMADEEWDTVIHTNLDSFYNVLKPLVMGMVRRRRGRIVTIASVSGLMGNRGQVNYSAAKGGVIAATKALSLELAKRGITVNCVAPGLIDTELVDEDVKSEILKQIPMRRVGTAEDVAGAVSYLLSPDAGYVTRQVISVNGGLV